MLVQTEKNFKSAIEVLRSAKIVAFDTETNGKYVHKGHKLCGISAFCHIQEPYTIGFYFPFRHSLGDNLFNRSENLPEEWMQELSPIFARKDLTTIWHNFKFDAGMLRREGIEIGGTIYDTLAMSVLCDENWDHSLDGLEKRFFDTSSKKKTMQRLEPYLKGKKDYSKVPPADMEPYACNDAKLTYDVWERLLDELAAQEQLQLWSDEATFLRCLFEMEWEGILIERSEAARLSAEAEARMRELEDEMGFDPQKLAELARRLYLPAPVGLGLKNGSRTKTSSPDFPDGLPQMRETDLAKHDDVPLVRTVLEYRGLVKLNSTFYAGFLHHADDQDRIHPTYNTGGEVDKYGTRTGRLTCSKPNIQQLPRDPRAGVRRLLIPPARHRLYEFDYNQIEYRLAGVYSEEEAILNAYREGSDMHQLTADLLGISRHDGKTYNFTVLYGGGVDRLATVFGISKELADEYLKAYWSKYPKLRRLTYACTRAAKERNWIRLWDGHRRHFAHEFEHHKAFNSLIQGGAAKIVQRTMCRIHQTRKPYRMVYQVHDALGFYIPDDFREDWLVEIEHEMSDWVTDSFDLPFPVEGKNIHPDKEVHICTEECTAA